MEPRRLKWWYVSWKRVALALAIVFGSLCSLAVLADFAFYRFMPWYLARQTCRDDPSLGIMPQNLADKSMAAIDGMRVQRFDYSLQLPWNDLVLQRDFQKVSFFAFSRGVTVVVNDPNSEFSQLTLFRGDSKAQTDAMVRVLGGRALSSNYDLLAAELNASPSDVHWWASRVRNTHAMILLNMKSMETIDANAIYPVGNEEMHGFQFGNPSTAPFRIRLDLFDRADRKYEISFHGAKLTHPVMTQAELNAVIWSLRPIPYPASRQP